MSADQDDDAQFLRKVDGVGQDEEETRETLAAFIARHKLTMTAKLVEVGPDPESKPPHNDPHRATWSVELHNGGGHGLYLGQKLRTEYHMGGAHRRWKKSAPYRKAAGQDDMAPGEPVAFAFWRGRGRTLYQQEAFDTWSEPTPPDLEGVLDSLRLDAEAGAHDCFEDFADEFGYDKDSRKAEEVYRACQSMRSKLRKFMGSAALAELMETERL